ncbi:MAG: MFS transporter [Muribaculaceae bacterium]
MQNLKLRLIVMNFLEFAVWGAYLTCMGAYLAGHGMGGQIGYFYAVQGFVSLFMPALVGIVADRYIPAQKVYGICHLLAGAFMLLSGWYALSSGDAVEFGILFTLYTISVAFYMPTIGLANSVAFTALNKAGLDTVKAFPPIRVFGTVGFICSMLFVDFAGFQNNYNQFLVSGALSIVLFAYAFTLPECPVTKGDGKSRSLVDVLGLRAFTLFKDKRMAIFFIFSMLLGVSLQITNGFANPFIQSFGAIEEFANTFAVQHANALISLSQTSETLCILLIPFCMKRFGIKNVMLIAMVAWVLRFGLFGLGNPSDGVWMFVLSMIVYGVAFDFFNVSGALYVDQVTDSSIRSSAQGLFMIMTNGIGATIGTLSAQQVVNHFVYSQSEAMAQVEGWSTTWLIFASYALIVAVLFAIIFKNPVVKKGTN